MRETVKKYERNSNVHSWACRHSGSIVRFALRVFRGFRAAGLSIDVCDNAQGTLDPKEVVVNAYSQENLDFFWK
jgi:hypothetical protein